jgi:hypothetical protein
MMTDKLDRLGSEFCLIEVLFQNSRERTKAIHEKMYGIVSVRKKHAYSAWKKPG